MNNQAPTYAEFLQREQIARTTPDLTRGEQEAGINKYNNLMNNGRFYDKNL